MGESEPSSNDPGPAREDERRAPSRRERAVAAIVELAAGEGYAGVDVERVAARAGITAADFGRCFDDLDDCLLAAVELGWERALECAGAAAEAAVERADRGDPGARAEQVLRSIVGAVTGCVVAEPRLARVCLVESAALRERVLEPRQAFLDRLAGLLEEQVGRVAPPPRRLACEMIVGGVYEVIQRRVRGGDGERVGALAAPLTALWVPLLRAG